MSRSHILLREHTHCFRFNHLEIDCAGFFFFPKLLLKQSSRAISCMSLECVDTNWEHFFLFTQHYTPPQASRQQAKQRGCNQTLDVSTLISVNVNLCKFIESSRMQKRSNKSNKDGGTETPEAPKKKKGTGKTMWPRYLNTLLHYEKLRDALLIPTKIYFCLE